MRRLISVQNHAQNSRVWSASSSGQSRPTWANFGAASTKFGPNSTTIGQLWPRSAHRQHWGRLRQQRGQHLPGTTTLGSIRAELRTNSAGSGEIGGRCWPTPVRLRTNSGQLEPECCGRVHLEEWWVQLAAGRDAWRSLEDEFLRHVASQTRWDPKELQTAPPRSTPTSLLASEAGLNSEVLSRPGRARPSHASQHKSERERPSVRQTPRPEVPFPVEGWNDRGSGLTSQRGRPEQTPLPTAHKPGLLQRAVHALELQAVPRHLHLASGWVCPGGIGALFGEVW